ncbi:hypothetical protein [Actinoplanes sp. NPDC051859]|uniref:hypothetical protein n=1 Tax=Actinoplanes sp. NPDC051859 TaxID=3363909 RepID=UPI0037991698
MRHKPVRVWFKPWHKRCRCGCRWFPCPDSVTLDRPRPGWNDQTAVYDIITPALRNERPLMTPGQEWRSRQRWPG